MLYGFCYYMLEYNSSNTPSVPRLLILLSILITIREIKRILLKNCFNLFKNSLVASDELKVGSADRDDRSKLSKRK